MELPTELPRKCQKQAPSHTPQTNDTLDPVEKLLSYPTFNNDFLNEGETIVEPEREETSSSSSSPYNVSLNFTKILNDNIRSYYHRAKRCPIEFYSDNSSFSVLNKRSEPEQAPARQTKSFDVPFFRNVNFNPKPPSAYTFDEYLAIDDEEEEAKDPLSSDEEPPSVTNSPLLPNSKMSFHYRHNDNLNLSLNDTPSADPHDVMKYLNKRSILSGRASEMVSTGNFLINDFFL